MRSVRADEVGQKLARLARLAAEGLPVPPFFALTAGCFRVVADALRDPIERELRSVDFTDPASVERASDAVRALFGAAAVPPKVAHDILAAFDDAFAPGTLVAVRASTISEDSTQDAFAGMSDSFLYVPRELLLERIRGCWTSAFNAESLLYRHVQGLGPLEVDVAVGVQQMALGERSFVVFTCDPRTGAAQCVIAAGYGIGEGVVQERVGVDHYFLAADGGIGTRIADKPERLGFSAARPEAGPVALPVPEELRGRPVLTDDEIRQLDGVGRRIERIFGVPQDIEGTFTADGALHLVQSRPITVDLSLRRQWSSANVTESFPGVTTALTYTFAQKFYSTIFHDLYRRLGVDARTLRRNRRHLERMIGWHHGRIYYELGAWYHLHQQLAVFPLFRASWEQMMGISGAPPVPGAGRPGSRSAMLRLALPLCRVAVRFARHDRAMRRFEAWWESLISPLRSRDWSAVDPLARIQAFHEVWAAVGEEWGVTLINDSVLSTTAAVTERLLRRWVPGRDQALLSDLLCGDEENHSTAIVLSVVRLAERARSCPSLLEALAARDGRDVREVWQAVERGEFGGELLEQLRAHLHRYGDRGLQELKMEQPTVRQAPWELLRLVGDYARSDLGVAELQQRERLIRAEAERRLTDALRGRPVQLTVVRLLLAKLRQYVRHRENSRYCRSELFGLAKAVFTSLGEELAARGVLRGADDVVHLTQDELFGYFDGTGTSEEPQAVADARRAEFEAADEEPPMRFTTLGPVRHTRPTAWQPASVPGVLRGLGSSGGTARGIARIVLDPRTHVTGPSDEGLILVARETDPGWLFLMLRAAGIVVERGTMLSHTAITGRKFGIPTIVALPGATTAIPDGALVEIDGTRGLVTVLDGETERA
ncbi:PEP/pyruvate-binding domain-containing protein [Streptomyces humicola]|nr:PEP/pyruvate-binding domain-containing protein [Streptomyces humicola]